MFQKGKLYFVCVFLCFLTKKHKTMIFNYLINLLESTYVSFFANIYNYAWVNCLEQYVWIFIWQEVFSALAYRNDWRGTFKKTGDLLPAASYYYVVDPNNGEEPINGLLYITY